LSVSNHVLQWVMACTLVGVGLCLYVPWLAQPLQFATLNAAQLFMAVGVGVASVWGALGVFYFGSFVRRRGS
jgi:hypothetical protein